MAEVPRRLVLHSETPRYLIRGDALFGFRHERHRHKPLLQRKVGIVEQSACSRAEVQTAIRAFIFAVWASRLALGINPVDFRAIAT